jgi:hypothetical protein
VLHLQEIVRGPLDALADMMAMSGAIQKRAEDQHIKGALEQLRPLLFFLSGHEDIRSWDQVVEFRMATLGQCTFPELQCLETRFGDLSPIEIGNSEVCDVEVPCANAR